MADTKCDVCREPKLESALTKCATCANRSCEECGRTVTVHSGSSSRSEKWECAACEFGGGGPPE